MSFCLGIVRENDFRFYKVTKVTDVIRPVTTQPIALKPVNGVDRSVAAVSNSSEKFAIQQNDNSNFNQRLVVDPQAGVITEYLTTRGDVQAQIPSSVVVAYLRAGLTADGLSQEQATRLHGSTSA